MQIKTVEANLNNKYGASYAIWKLKENDSTTAIVNYYNGTACTDFFTDKLMYPELNPISFKFGFDSDKTRIAISYSNEYEYNNFINYGLPILNKVEKLNKYSRTKIKYKNKKTKTILLESSPKWMQCTFSMSLYLKLLRNLTFILQDFHKTIPDLKAIYRDCKDLTLEKDLILKLMYSGSISLVNKGMKYKHGWKNANEGNHSNNGIAYTIYSVTNYSKPETLSRYENGVFDKIKSNFLRIKNLIKLQDQLKDFNYNEMPIL